MRSSFRNARGCALLVAFSALAFAPAALASRPGAASAPPASSVQSSVQQPRHVQADESASLRQGIVSAVDTASGRIQVQGIWLETDDTKTRLLRQGRPAALATLKVGETIRFTVAPGTAGVSGLRVIYVP